jgi:hypothetical protein
MRLDDLVTRVIPMYGVSSSAGAYRPRRHCSRWSPLAVASEPFDFFTVKVPLASNSGALLSSRHP